MDLEINEVLDHMIEECKIKLEKEQNDIINHDPQIAINGKAKEIPNWLENLMWETHDLEESSLLHQTCSKVTEHWNLEWERGLGIFLVHVKFVVEWH